MKHLKTIFRKVLIGSLVILLSACSGGGSSSGGSSSEDSNAYLGSSSLSGSVVVSSKELAQVSNATSSHGVFSVASNLSALSKVASVLTAGLSAQATLDEGTAKLYEVASDGSLVDTGITTPVSNGEYEFKNIADNKTYVVVIDKIGKDLAGDTNLLRQKTITRIDDGVTTATANVTIKTGIIQNFIIEKIIQETNGKDISRDTLDDLTEKIASASTQLLKEGLKLTNVSSYSAENVQTISATPAEKDATEQLLDFDEVLDKTKEAKFKVKLAKDDMSLEEAKQFIRDVFGISMTASDDKNGGSGGDNGPPEWFIEQFAKQYLEGASINVHDFAIAFFNSLKPTEENSTRYPNVAAIETDMLEAINTKVSALYDLYDGETINDDIPATAKAVFPKTGRWTLPADNSQEMNVPQAITIMGLSGMMNNLEFNPMEFVSDIGFAVVDSNTVYLIETEVSPIRTYQEVSEGNWQEVKALDSWVSVFVPEGSGKTVEKVVLKYTNKNGQVQSVAYDIEEQELEGESISSQSQGGKISVLAQKLRTAYLKGAQYNQSLKTSAQSSGEEHYRISPWWNDNDRDKQKYIKDYDPSKPMTIQVCGDSNCNTVYASQSVSVVDFDVAAINWIYPAGPNQELIKKQNYDPTFIPQELEIDSNDKASVTLRWQKPTANIPEGHFLAYAVDLGIQAQKINHENNTFDTSSSGISNWDYEETAHGYKWKKIWNTWDDNRFIRKESYKLRHPLNKTKRDSENNYQTQYEVNITPLLIKSDTGRIVWRGSQSRTSFKVGLETPWEIELHGTVSFEEGFQNRMPRDTSGNVVEGTWKIGLFKMGGQNESFEWTDAYWTSGKSQKSPVGSGENLMLATLGTTAEIIDSNREIEYKLPAFSRTDNIIQRFSNYALIVWYDQDDSAGFDDWITYGEDPHANKIDFMDYRSIEYAEHFHGNIWADQSMVRYDEWNHETNTSSWKELTTEDNQEVNHTVGQTYKFF